MRWITLALLVGFVGSQQVHYEPIFSQKKTYLYHYDGVVLTGLPEDGLAKGGLKITSKVQISSMGEKKHLLKIISPQILEYSGIWPSEEFIPARKLTRRMSAQLSQPVIFEYTRGRVGNLFAPPDIPENILNIHRAILNILQISIKKNQNIYELQESGLEGVCHASYTIQEDKKARQIAVTKAKDLDNCQEKVSETKGIELSQQCETCQQKGKNLRSVSTYTYALKGVDGGAEISEVVSQETHQFTPFNELDGAASTESRQHLYLLERKDQAQHTPSAPMEKRAGLRYQFSNELSQVPMQLVKPSANDTKVAKVLEDLAHLNQEKAHPDAPQMFLQLIQLLRSADTRGLQSIWKKNGNKQGHRQWILDAIPTTATHEAVQFIQAKIEQGELSQLEAAQAVVFVLHSIKPDCHGVDNATMLLSSPYMQRNPLLRKITLLAYGSLVQKYCTTIRVCPDEALQPLHELVVEAGSRGHEEETVLGLKAIGNAGQAASLKRIQKLLPGFSSGANGVSNRIHAAAVMALRNIGRKEPRKVQNIAMQLLMNTRNRADMRMRAFIVLMETKPSLALVTTVTDSMNRETNVHLTSFIYSYMKSLGGSSVPELQSLPSPRDDGTLMSERENILSDIRVDHFLPETAETVEIHIDVIEVTRLWEIKNLREAADMSEVGERQVTGVPTESTAKAAICNIAVKRLSQRCDRLSYRYSKGFHFGLFRDKFLAGIEGNLYLIKKSEGILPTTMIANFRSYGLGVSSNFLEVGIQMEGLHHALSKGGQSYGRGLRNNDTERVVGKVSDWKPLPPIKTMANAYIKLFDQEIAFVELNQNGVQELMKALNNRARRDGVIARFMNQLQRGISTKWTKSLLASEVRHMVPTSVGLPLELAFYYTVVSTITAQAKVKFDPTPSNLTMPQFLNSSIQIESQLVASSVKDVIGIMGINSPLIQAGVEVQLKTSTLVPLNLTGKINYKKRNVQIETPPLHRERQLLSIRTQSFAFSRNMEDLAAARITPLVPSGEAGVRIRMWKLAKNSTGDDQDMMGRVLPLAIPKGSVCSAEDPPDIPIPTVRQSCVKANTFGFQMCYETSVEETGLNTNSPLYKMVGVKSMDIAIKPVITSTPITKLQIELQMQTGDKPFAKVNRLMRRNDTDSSETTQAEGKLVLLRLKKIFQAKDKHQQEGRVHRYTTSSSMSSSQSSRRRSTRRSSRRKEERPRPHDSHTPTARDQELEHSRHSKHHVEGCTKYGRRSTSSSQSSNRRSTRRSADDKEGDSRSRRAELRHGKHLERKQQGRHGQSGRHTSENERVASAQQESSSQTTGWSLSSSSSAVTRGHRRAPAHRGSSSFSRRRRAPSSSSSQSGRALGRRPGGVTVRNSTLPSSASLSHSSSLSPSSSSSSSSSSRRVPGNRERTGLSHSRRSSSSSRRSSSVESRRRGSQHAARGQSGSSQRREDTSSSSFSQHRKTVEVWPTVESHAGAGKPCKSGRCIKTQTKTYTTTIHRVKKHRRTWVSHPESSKPGGHVFQLHFKPTSISTSQNRGQLSFGSSLETSSESRTRYSKSFSSSSSSTSSSSSSQQSTFLGDSASPIFSLLTRAITSDNQERGYQTKAYLDSSMEARSFHVLVDELQEGGKWRACLDAEMPNPHRAVGVMKWGKNCQDYKIAAKATTGRYKHHPAVQLKAKWEKIPQSVKDAAEMISDNLAGLAFVLGFSEQHYKSPSHQLSVVAAATSQRTLDILVKTPKHIFSRQALLIPAPLPFDVTSPSVQKRGLKVLADLPAMVSTTFAAECTVVQDMFSPFSENSFKYQMPENCGHVLVQDCTSEKKFLALIKRNGESLTVQLTLPHNEIVMESTSRGRPQLAVNGKKVSMEGLPLTSLRSVSIEWIDGGLKITAPELGLQTLFFDGKMIKATQMPWMVGTTCGLCGRGNAQQSDEYQLPNRQQTKEVLRFAHSWLITGESCKDGCKLTRSSVKLDVPVTLHGQESKCYSIEKVLRCQSGCSPVKTVSVAYGFHCLPADSNMNPTDEQLKSISFAQKTEDLESRIEAHVSCSCPSDCK